MGEITGEIRRLLNLAFGTRNRATFPISGTGSAGMEAALINVLQPGERVAIGLNGFFGDRMRQIVERAGGVPIPIEAEWGRPIAPEQVRDALKRDAAIRLVALVHAETSTGVLQPLAEIRDVVRERGAFFLVDAVTSLAGHPVEVDRNGVDICYSGTQKAVAAPPGLSPMTFSERAVEHARKRERRVQSYYLDVALFEQYWGSAQFYHHTPPVNFYYALLEALRMVEEEGLEARYERHRVNHLALVAGLEAMGLAMHVEPAHRLWTLNAVRIPDGVDEARVRGRLLGEFGIEIGGGLGGLKGRVWRIGLMGVNSTRGNVLLLLAALQQILPAEGFRCASGIPAAQDVYRKHQTSA
jgi:alanine-glyoxylate transaminase/serine-glyoxylate transaminase/serine-pyruvate transaminase